MSQADVEKVREHLKQTKQEMQWVLAVLNDPELHLKEYDLSQEEKDEVLQECLVEMEEMLLALTQVLSEKVHLHIESTTERIKGPVHSDLSRSGEIRIRNTNIRIEMAAPGGPGPRPGPRPRPTRMAAPGGPGPKSGPRPGLKRGSRPSN